MPGKAPPFSSQYIIMPVPSCFRLFRQAVCDAFAFAALKAGSINPARMAMMAITTSSSMSVKARRDSINSVVTRRGLLQAVEVLQRQRVGKRAAVFKVGAGGPRA